MTVIKVAHLTQGYGKTTVLRDVNVTVEAGEILALIGPSGAGKTTLINTIMGMLRPKSGTVNVLGHAMPNRQLLSQIGFMAQTDALYTTLTGRENLAFFAALQAVAKADLATRITYVAEVVNLREALDIRVGDYSGGMKRRLSLAIALLAQPELLILDEPTVGIDPELRQQIWQELQRLATAGTTIVLTTHVMEDAEQAQQVMMIRNGAVIAQGTPDDLTHKYQVPTIEAVFMKAGQMQDADMGSH